MERTSGLMPRATLAVLATAWALGSACGGGTVEGDRTYTMQGQVLSVAPERKETIVKHEAIPGFMDAMTMPYYVRDGREIAGLKPGDLITSTLVVEGGGAAYLREVRRVGEAPLERAATSESASPGASSTGMDLLQEGEPAPNARFVDQDGRTREFASFFANDGSVVVLTFIYTRCPLPNFCPLMDRHFAAVQARLATTPGYDRVHLLTVSFDPAHDTPAVLKRHAASLGADPARWTFLTGTQEDVDRFAARFGVSVMRAPSGEADITHNLRTAVIDRTGRLAKVYTGNDWTPEQLLANLETLAPAR